MVLVAVLRQAEAVEAEATVVVVDAPVGDVPVAVDDVLLTGLFDGHGRDGAFPSTGAPAATASCRRSGGGLDAAGHRNRRAADVSAVSSRFTVATAI